MTKKIHLAFLVFLSVFSLFPIDLIASETVPNALIGHPIGPKPYESLACNPPINFSFSNQGPVFDFWWNGIFNAENYQLEIGEVGFEPGADEELFDLETTSSLYFDVVFQEGGKNYEAYLRTICNNGETSSFAGPYLFHVPPSCGDTFYDSGGPDDDLSLVDEMEQTICPNSPDKYVQLAINELDADPCCAIILLRIGSLLEVVSFDGSHSPVYSALTAGECIEFEFLAFNDIPTGSGWDISVECTDCPAVPEPVVQALTNEEIMFRWGQLGDITQIGWEIGEPGFTPFSGEALFSDLSFVTSLTLDIDGLASNTPYEIYFRNECGLETSTLSAPVAFTTAPTCGDTFYDHGGPNGPMAQNASQFRRLTSCPETPGDAIVADFSSFDLGDNSFLVVFDGSTITAEELVRLEGAGAAGPFISSHQTGCLSFDLFSGDTLPPPGWEAAITCTTCPVVNHYNVQGSGLESAIISWQPLLNATSYEWEAGEPGFTPSTGTAVASGTVSGVANFAEVTGLEKNTIYEIYVRAICSTEGSPYFHSCQFSTQATCGDLFLDAGGSNAQYGHDLNYQTTICSTEPNDPVTVQFNLFSTEGCCDFLTVYDATDIIINTSLGSFSGSVSPGTFTATNPSGCLTFEFVSNGSIAGNGWEALVSCNATPIIETIAKQEPFDLFPNPTSSQINLTLNGNPTTHQQIEVRDINGYLLFEKMTNGKDNIIATDIWPAGTYFVILKNNERVATKRFVKM